MIAAVFTTIIIRLVSGRYWCSVGVALHHHRGDWDVRVNELAVAAEIDTP
jgi:hypothetical protein